MRNSARYLIRFDDICSTMNWEIWNLIEKFLIEKNIKPILAVIPENLDKTLLVSDPRSDFWSKVQFWDKIGWSIAMHGYQHKYELKNSGYMGISKNTEFATLSYDSQLNKLSKAKRIFEDNKVKCKIFVAPSHSFDFITIKVLNEIGINCISDGFLKEAKIDKNNVIWVPSQLWNDFRDKKSGLWTICIHHNTWTIDDVNKFIESVNVFEGKIVNLESEINKTLSVKNSLDYIYEQFYSFLLFKLPRFMRKLIKW